MQIVECVPNFSEGRNSATIEAIALSINKVDSVEIFKIDSGYDANRTVITFAGTPEGVQKAAFNAIKTASELINMRDHFGAHPRIGATDVCPLIPVKNISMQETSIIANNLAKDVGEKLQIPVFLYEKSAKNVFRSNLANIRRGGYENFSDKLGKDDWTPDFGPTQFNYKTGATVIGARDYLIAFNVTLDTNEVNIAKRIAAIIRESGIKVKSSNGKLEHKPGLFKNVKAIGWYLPKYKGAQISINFTDYRITSVKTVVNKIKKLADSYSCTVLESELIGLIPGDALVDNYKYLNNDKISDKNIIKAAHDVGLLNFTKENILDYHINMMEES